MAELECNNIPEHIAIILDGNRRWARAHGLEVKQGHKQGAETLKQVVRDAQKIGVKYLTVYAFSTENWKRTKEEVGALMKLLTYYLDQFAKTINDENVVIRVLGDQKALPEGLQKSIKAATDRTKNNTGIILNIALNYGGRDEITKAVKSIVQKVKDNEINVEDINEELIGNNLYTKGEPDPDLLIRTSGEMRTSNFLPWQLVYSEFLFIEKNWPDFNKDDLIEAINVYNRRTRKFGAN